MNVAESDKKINECVKMIQSICQENRLTVEVDFQGVPILVLHYKEDGGYFNQVSRELQTTPF